ncbi:hypothetical protein JIN85_14710 [Luteolibacter pohnpeiensis]|uniref:Uncharacterized protein n=1 Tax=Luteolibacter pohnpeiensis TaxID=454153 RepID=A0A934VWV4_9BACT|nr:hypothetical protein [Luteolibacter pohnpeiensis]MBK1883670.1 hypothetical protein [Luteolibacter pohnpeiensis]
MDEVVIPEARGKARAISTFLARGGGLRSISRRYGKAGARYTEGPLKGLTHDQALAKAELLWANASPAVKKKYADMASPMNEATDSEIAEAFGTMPESDQDATSPTAVTPSSSPAPVSRATTVNPNATAGAGRGMPLQPLGSNQVVTNATAEGPTAPTRQSLLKSNSIAGVPEAQRGIQEPAKPAPRINRFTGRPFGWLPPEVANAPLTDEYREELANRVTTPKFTPTKSASRGKPLQPLGSRPEDGYTGPKVRYTPGMGYVPVAEPVTGPEAVISYDDYEAAGRRMKSAGSTVEQDRKDSALRAEFGRQRMGTSLSQRRR